MGFFLSTSTLAVIVFLEDETRGYHPIDHPSSPFIEKHYEPLLYKHH